MKMTKTRCLTVSAMLFALGLVLPFLTGQIPQIGQMLCPMHIPVFLCGLICGARYGLLCGIIGPLLSSLITGMPGPAYMPQMMIELAAYGLFTGLFANIIRTGKGLVDLMCSLIGGMLIGRVIAGAARALIFARGTYTMAAWVASFFVNAVPGIILHVLLIPAVIYALQKTRLIPERF